jgi:hypothetical protein
MGSATSYFFGLRLVGVLYFALRSYQNLRNHKLGNQDSVSMVLSLRKIAFTPTKKFFQAAVIMGRARTRVSPLPASPMGPVAQKTRSPLYYL